MCAGHFPSGDDEPIVQIVGSGTTLEDVGEIRQTAKILEWLDEQGYDTFLTGWKMLKTPNDVGGFYYRLCLTTHLLNDEEYMHLKMVFPDDIWILDTDDEEEE